MNTEALKNSMNGKTPELPNLKRPVPNRDQHHQRLEQVNEATQSEIAALAQTGVNTINAQVFAFDSKLTRYERDTARAMADRLRQSPLRIQQYLMQELTVENTAGSDFAALIDEVLEVPDLTTNFLSIALSTALGALPL
ncbi:MAG: hypothetical protein IGS48_21050 [Oscillatoriales cyanobacterium C42_A2020_001]|nr:hypothetical protein [Leptolyngbyaceae cyanobacterium C42_A2020_001]